MAAGASETVTVDVPGYFLASYDANGAKGYILDAGDYYFAVGNGAHEALNNVLAAKCGDAVAGKLIDQDGNVVTGNTAAVATWTAPTPRSIPKSTATPVTTAMWKSRIPSTTLM